MDIKKQKHVTIENKKPAFILIGVILSFAIALEWMEWSNQGTIKQNIKSSALFLMDDELIVEFAAREIPKPPKPSPTPDQLTVVKKVEPIITPKTTYFP